MSSSLAFCSNSVRDGRNERVGRVVGSELVSGTDEPRSLLIEFDEDAQGVDAAGSALWLPFDAVASIRRDGIRLSGTVPSLTLGKSRS